MSAHISRGTSLWGTRETAGTEPDGAPAVHRFPQPVHMSHGPATLGEWAGIPLFPSPYYY
jgi:hypothetical protein